MIELALIAAAVALLLAERRHIRVKAVQEKLTEQPNEIVVRCGDEMVRYLRADAVKAVMHEMLLAVAAATARELIAHFNRRLQGFTLTRRPADRSTLDAGDE
jgi:predicted transcriptional regulator